MSLKNKKFSIFIYVMVGVPILFWSGLLASKVANDFSGNTFVSALMGIVVFLVSNILLWLVYFLIESALGFLLGVNSDDKKTLAQEDMVTEEMPIIAERVTKNDSEDVSNTKEQSEQTIENESCIERFPKYHSIEKLNDIYYFLIEKNLIKKSTKIEDFLFWFGFDGSTKLQRKIEWLGTKQNLRDLLLYMYKEELKTSHVERLVPHCFSKEGEPMKLAKNKQELSTVSDALKNLFST